MGLHLMLQFPSVVCAPPHKKKLLALQGGSKTCISLGLRFCDIKTCTSNKRGNVCPGMEGTLNCLTLICGMIQL